MRRSRLCAAFLSACLLVPAAASDGPRWLLIQSPNFEVFTTAGERSGRDLSRRFEQIRSFFIGTLGFAPKAGPPVRIVVFRSGKEFAPYAPNESASAAYLGAEDRDYIVMTNAAGRRFAVALHEYTHLFLKHTGVKAPLWFNEGLAELYSSLKPVASKIQVGEPIGPHCTLLRKSKWIDLQTLLAAESDSPLYSVKSQAGLFYAESWALVHMLYLDPPYRPGLRELLAGIRSGASMPDTFRKAYSKSIEQVQADLESYVRGNRFSSSLFDATLPKEVGAPVATEASPLDTGLLLAEILAHNPGKAAEGRARYNNLGRENPKDWRIEEGLARLSLREHKTGEALAHYARAAGLGSPEPKMYLVYGRLLRAADKSAEAVPVLKRATELDPNYLDARLELGYAYVVADDPAAALEQFELVKSVPPEQAFGYFHTLAYTLYRLDRRTEAKIAAAACRSYAKTPEQIDRLNHLTETLNYEPKAPATREDHPTSPAHEPEPAILPPKPAEDLLAADGTLRQIDCLGGKIRMWIAVGGQPRSFALLDPGAVDVNDGRGPLNFTCGPQHPRRIRIAYDGKAHVMPGTVGVIRKIEFPQ